jgi:glycosyltransferase involved in cell wall biosynthesis
MRQNILVLSDLDMKRFDTNTEFMAQFLKECGRRDIAVEYVLPTEPCALVRDSLKDACFTYTVLSGWWDSKDRTKRNNISIAFQLFGIIRDRKADLAVFNFCAEITALIVGIMAKAALLKTCLVWHEHGEMAGLGKGFSIKRYVSGIRILALFLDYFCPVAHSQEALFAERGVSPKKIKALYNGVSLQRFDQTADRDTLLSGLGIKANGHIVATIASLTEGKGIQYLLKAADRVLLTFPETVFLIVGDGPLMQELRRLAASYSLDNRVFFLGTRNDIQNILAVSDLFVLPSLSEAFGMVNIEAMAAGKPVIATRTGGIPEVVADGESGYLAAPRNVDELTRYMIRLLQDREMRMSMGRAGRRIVEEKFTVDRMVKNYFDVYDSLLSGRGKLYEVNRLGIEQ